MRRFLLTLTAMVALAFSSAGATGAVAATPVSESGAGAAGVSGVSISAGSKSQAKKRAMRKCRKIKKQAKRKKCLKRVRRKFSKPRTTPSGPPAATIDVRDKYFSPAIVNIKKGDSILWNWNALNADAHNVNLVSGPSGVKRIDFNTPSSPSVGFQFKRTFTVPGTYNFVCSIHYLMTMRVEVSK